MTNLYKELSLSPDSSATTLQNTLRELLVETRRMFSAAESEEESEHIENRMILIKEAMRVFASDESKDEYDAELQAEKQQQHESKILKYGNIHLTDEKLRELLRDAVDEEDWGQILSITSIIEERGCEDSEYYAALVKFYTNKHDNAKALSLLEEGMARFGTTDSKRLALCGVLLGTACLGKDNFDLDVARRCVAISLEKREELNGLAEVLDFQFDLEQKHYPLVSQKVHQIASVYSHDNEIREIVCHMLIEHIDNHVSSRANGVEYFESDESYQLYRDLMNTAIRVATDNKSQLQNKLDSWEEKQLIDGAWWGLAGYIIYGFILFFAPGGLPFFGALLIVMCIVTYVMLCVPKWHVNYFDATGKLRGVNNVFRIINTFVGKWIQLIFKFYKWAFRFFMSWF